MRTPSVYWTCKRLYRLDTTDSLVKDYGLCVSIAHIGTYSLSGAIVLGVGLLFAWVL